MRAAQNACSTQVSPCGFGGVVAGALSQKTWI